VCVCVCVCVNIYFTHSAQHVACVSALYSPTRPKVTVDSIVNERSAESAVDGAGAEGMGEPCSSCIGLEEMLSSCVLL
jgi:hypothetical protein